MTTLIRVLCLLLLFWGGALRVAAQEDVDYARWDLAADRIEAAVENSNVSTDTLESLRDEVAGWRAQFLDEETGQEARLRTLRTQIEALGDPPAEGESEPDDLAERRAELNALLTQMDAPRRTATEAFNRANALVGALDATIRTRQTDALFKLGPSPLNPTVWPEAAAGFIGTIGTYAREIQRNWASDIQRQAILQNSLRSLLLLAATIAVLLRGRNWFEWLADTLQTRTGRFGRRVLADVITLGGIVVAVTALVLLSATLVSTGMFGTAGTTFIRAIPYAGFCFFAALWLGARVFPRVDFDGGLLDLPPDVRARGRRLAGLIGLVYALRYIGEAFIHVDDSEALRAVLAFPFILILGYFLMRAGRFLVKASHHNDGAQQSVFRDQVMRTVGRAISIAGLLAPIAAAVGYINLAEAVLFPIPLSLALIAVLVALHRIVADLYSLVFGSGGATEEALVPILISLTLAVLSLPVFSLIWGTRIATLSELWARFSQGIVLGEARITPGDLITVIAVFVIGYLLTRLLQGTLKTTVLPRTRLDVGARNAVTAGVGYVGIFLAAVASITAAGINLSSIAIVAGALSVGIGFGLQTIVSNFVSGIILLVERPIREGDWIDVGGTTGYVRNISVRSTRIETFDRTDVIVPNADLIAAPVTNYTFGNSLGRLIVNVGVAYGTDTRRVEQILHEATADIPNVVSTPPPIITFSEFGADSLNFEIRLILRDVNMFLAVKSEVHHRINERFVAEGIEIPFAQRDLWIRNPEALRAAPEGGAA